MKDQKKTEIKVGITAIVSILILLYIFGWAKNLQLFSNDKILNIRFNSVAGLETGDRVTVNGLRKGYVEDIKIDGNNVLVKAIMEQDTKLNEDANINIMMLDLMGGKKIEIKPGTSSVAMDFGKIQTGRFNGDISTAMAALSSVQGELTDVIIEAKKSLSSINQLFGDEEMKDQIKQTIKNFNGLAAKINELAENNKDAIAELLKSSTNLAKSANVFLNENSDTLKNTLSIIKNVITNSNNLLLKLNSLADEVNNKENNIGKLLYDEHLLNDIKVTLQQVKDLTKILIDQLKGDGVNVDANIF